MIPFLLLLSFLLPSLTQCMETDLSIKTNEPQFIKDLKHKRNNLKSELEVKKDHFWMWTPEDDEFHSIYNAPDSATLRKTIKLYPQDMRVKAYSVFGVIIISPNISVQEKRDIIQKLYKSNFRPTLEDKDLAILEEWEMNLEEPFF